jgi:uncharacterized protein (TIGR02588 family)
MAKSRKKQPKEPVLEWIAAGIGLLLTLGIVAVIGREAVNGESEAPPAIEVRALSLARTATGFVVEVAATNRSGATAAAVQIEGELSSGGATAETSSLSFDYVPGHATRKGGLFFREDPRRHRLELRALGYQEP